MRPNSSNTYLDEDYMNLAYIEELYSGTSSSAFAPQELQDPETGGGGYFLLFLLFRNNIFFVFYCSGIKCADAIGNDTIATERVKVPLNELLKLCIDVLL
jgi:hypothetical protein